MKIVYACINTSIDAPVNKGMIKRDFEEKGLDHVSEISLSNVRNFDKIVEWNNINNIQLYRVTPSLFPWMSEYKFKDLKDYDEILSILNRIGKFVKEKGQRLTFHPDYFVNLSSNKPTVVENSIKDLEKHNEIADMLMLDNSSYNKINIHVGGAYGDKESVMNRFINNFKKLSKNLKKRLTVENDSKKSLFNILDLCKISNVINIPITLDIHHHRLFNEGIELKDAMEFAFSTWNAVTPIVNLSEGDSHAHNEFIENKINNYSYDFDIIIEAKTKERAVLKYRNI